MTMKKYYEEMSSLRGIAILLVLLGHSIIIVPINLLDIPWCKTLYRYIYYFHMPLFFILSGFFYNCNGNYGNFVIGKVKRILIPYLFFSIIDLVPRHLFPSLINGSNTLKQDMLSIVISGGQYWFLYTLFMIFLIYPVMDRIKNKRIIILILLMLILLQFINVTSILRIDTIIKYIFYFTLGNLLRKIYSSKIKETMGKPYIALSLFIVFILFGLIQGNPVVNIIKALIGSIMAYSMVSCIKSRKFKDILNNFGKYSLQLYLLNGFMLVPARIITVKIFNITNPLLIIIIIFVFNALVGILLSKYVIDKINLFRFLSGIKIIKNQTQKQTVNA